jgi:hypothetical protein
MKPILPLVFYRAMDALDLAALDPSQRQVPRKSVETDFSHHIWENVQTGSHTYFVELIDNNGRFLNPPRVAGVEVIVR